MLLPIDLVHHAEPTLPLSERDRLGFAEPNQHKKSFLILLALSRHIDRANDRETVAHVNSTMKKQWTACRKPAGAFDCTSSWVTGCFSILKRAGFTQRTRGRTARLLFCLFHDARLAGLPQRRDHNRCCPSRQCCWWWRRRRHRFDAQVTHTSHFLVALVLISQHPVLTTVRTLGGSSSHLHTKFLAFPL